MWCPFSLGTEPTTSGGREITLARATEIELEQKLQLPFMFHDEPAKVLREPLAVASPLPQVVIAAESEGTC
jgi:hypothetical protein